MGEIVLNSKIKLKRGTEESLSEYVPLEGEPCAVSDNIGTDIKIGDGEKKISELSSLGEIAYEKIQRATSQEINQGTDEKKLITPSSLKDFLDSKDFYYLTGNATSVPSDDLNSLRDAGIYTGSGSSISNGPESTGTFLLIVESHGGFYRQTIDYGGSQYVRWGSGSAWADWVKITGDSTGKLYSLEPDLVTLESTVSLNYVTEPKQYSGNGGNPNSPSGESGRFYLVVERISSYCKQLIDFSGEQYIRWGLSDGSYWYNWSKITNIGGPYVTSSGANGNWDYRQWSDGKIEFWGRVFTTGAATQVVINAAYPFSLTGAPIVWTQGADNCWDLSRPIYVEPSINKNIKIYLYPRGTDSREYHVFVYAVGNLA